MYLKTARLFFPILLLFTIFISAASADELLEVQKKIDTKNKEYFQTQADIDKIKQDVASLSVSVYASQGELDTANKKVAAIRKELAKVEEDLTKKKDELALVINIRDQQVRYLYKYPGNSPLELFVAASGFANFTQLFGLQKRVLATSKDLIEVINEEVGAAQKTHDEVAKATADLEGIAAKISSQIASLQGTLYYQTNQQSVLTGQLVTIESNLKSLTSKQKQLIAAKLAKANRRQTVGEVAPISEPLPTPGFSPAYVWLTYGYPHRVGMNQYGAYGRAKAGQGYQTILKAYYKGIEVKTYPVPATIIVSGCNKFGQCFDGSSNYFNSTTHKGGKFKLEDYLQHIYEMPASWSTEALKAQAVAARTYAVRYGSPICPNENCQVVKWESNSSAWQRAVDATRGIVATYAGSPISAWYASTAGGYTLSSQEVWGGATPYAQGIRDFGPKGAYDGPNYGNSPWYHTFWNGKGCSGAFPWLTKSEISDIFNAALLSQVSSNYNQYLSQSPACPGRTAGWTASKVISTLGSQGIKDVGNLSNVIVAFDGKGHTSSVTFVSNKYPTGKTFAGGFFRSIFNLRSPGNLVILTSLYDVLIR